MICHACVRALLPTLTPTATIICTQEARQLMQRKSMESLSSPEEPLLLTGRREKLFVTDEARALAESSGRGAAGLQLEDLQEDDEEDEDDDDDDDDEEDEEPTQSLRPFSPTSSPSTLAPTKEEEGEEGDPSKLAVSQSLSPPAKLPPPPPPPPAPPARVPATAKPAASPAASSLADGAMEGSSAGTSRSSFSSLKAKFNNSQSQQPTNTRKRDEAAEEKGPEIDSAIALATASIAAPAPAEGRQTALQRLAAKDAATGGGGGGGGVGASAQPSATKDKGAGDNHETNNKIA